MEVKENEEVVEDEEPRSELHLVLEKDEEERRLDELLSGLENSNDQFGSDPSAAVSETSADKFEPSMNNEAMAPVRSSFSFSYDAVTTDVERSAGIKQTGFFKVPDDSTFEVITEEELQGAREDEEEEKEAREEEEEARMEEEVRKEGEQLRQAVEQGELEEESLEYGKYGKDVMRDMLEKKVERARGSEMRDFLDCVSTTATR